MRVKTLTSIENAQMYNNFNLSHTSVPMMYWRRCLQEAVTELKKAYSQLQDVVFDTGSGVLICSGCYGVLSLFVGDKFLTQVKLSDLWVQMLRLSIIAYLTKTCWLICRNSSLWDFQMQVQLRLVGMSPTAIHVIYHLIHLWWIKVVLYTKLKPGVMLPFMNDFQLGML